MGPEGGSAVLRLLSSSSEERRGLGLTFHVVPRLKSAGVHQQAGAPRSHLLDCNVDFSGRGEGAGDVSGVEFMDEGRKSTARAKKGYLQHAIGWRRPAAHKTLLTMEMLEFQASVTQKYSLKQV